MERHTKWLDEELTAKVDSYAELRRRHSDLEAEMSAKLVDVRAYFLMLCFSFLKVISFTPVSFSSLIRLRKITMSALVR